MNLEKVFNFIKEKRGYNIPILYKIITNKPLTEDELVFEGGLDLSYTDVVSLPDNLHIKGDLNLNNTNFSVIPNNLRVEMELYIEDTPISMKYSIFTIRRMIDDKGGYINEYINI
jgi:hypothetical protein